MDMRFLETFHSVATLKSFTDAAEELGIAQATASHRVKKLASDLGAVLLERRGSRVVLTDAGTRLLAESAGMLKDWTDLRERIGAPDPRADTIRLGVIESVLHAWLIPWIAQIRAERPKLALELKVDTTTSLLGLADCGALDIVVAALAAGDGVRKRVLAPMPMVFVGKDGLHTRKKRTLAQLAEHDLLTFQSGSHPHSELLTQLRKAKIKHARVHAISSISAMRQLVAGGFGVATLPRACLDAESSSAGLVALGCATELAPLPLFVSWRESPTAPGTLALVESLERTAKSFKRSER